MTAIVNFATKKAFKEAVKADPSKVWIDDPSIINPRTLTVSQLRKGETIYVTNHPKRSWFASIHHCVTGKIVVL